jgi:tRNA A37 methylthiotransferase MiaB
MNRAESERLAALLENHGYNSTDHEQDADLIIINSSVTEGIFEKVCISPEYGRSQEVIYGW